MNSWQKRRLFICFISVFAVWRKPNCLKGLKFNVPWNLLSSSKHSWFSDLWSRQITIPTYNQEKTNDGTDDEWQKLSAYTAIVYKEKVNKMLGLNFTLLPVLEKRRMDFFSHDILFSTLLILVSVKRSSRKEVRTCIDQSLLNKQCFVGKTSYTWLYRCKKEKATYHVTEIFTFWLKLCTQQPFWSTAILTLSGKNIYHRCNEHCQTKVPLGRIKFLRKLLQIHSDNNRKKVLSHKQDSYLTQ